MKVSFLGLFIWVSLWSPLIWAQSAELPQGGPWVEMASDANLKLKLYSNLKLTQEKLDLTLGTLQAKNLPESEFLDAWSKEFRRITTNYVQLQMQQNKWDTRQVSAVKRKLSKLNWKAFGELFLSQKKFLRTFLRHRGPGIFSALIFAHLFQFIFPFILASLGYNPMWGLILINLPTTLPAVYSYQLVKDQFYKIRLIKDMGGVQAYKDFVELNRQSLKGLNMKHVQDQILPLDARGDAVVINRQGPALQFWQMLGLKKENISLRSVRNFMIEHDLEDPLAWGLMNDDHLMAQDRLAMIVTHFHHQLPEELRAKFRLRFSESFTTIKNAPVRWRSVSQWVDDVLKSKSTQDIFENLENLPAHLTPQELTEVWDQILLPELARKDQLEYRQIRRLIRGFHSFKIKTSDYSQIEMTSSLKDDFLQYFRNALSPSSRRCFNTHEQVLQKLLQL